ncbi:trypsin-like serine protease [Vibrio sp. S11_S32]|uniref:trypsin-like serine protease n=1 Tax=Vibrio sp. S11_S32 TaxID=2720225 RepID=UPI0016803C3E|nr:trypsin-like serine protease [Vibrio sp. S11_S32]MBD1577098.1 trypsin-like serine protease [Vibrio sp. S11_S32]
MKKNIQIMALSIVFSSQVYAVDTSTPHVTVPWSDKDNATIVKANLQSGYCTGTIIGGKYVITAGHCGYDSDESQGGGDALSVTLSDMTHIEVVDHQATTSPDYIAYQTESHETACDYDHDGCSHLKTDVSIWKLVSVPQVEGFTPVSTKPVPQNEKIRMYGFGGTFPELNYIEQGTNETWRYGWYGYDGAKDPNHGYEALNSCAIEGQTDSDGWCDFVPVQWIIGYDIGGGQSTGGDSGAGYIDEDGYLIGIHSSQTAYGEDWYNWHQIYGINPDDYDSFISPDYIPESVGGANQGTRISNSFVYPYILKTINGWNYSPLVSNVTGDSPKKVSVQSLHVDHIDLMNTISTSGDVDIDYSSVTCTNPDEAKGSYSPDDVAPFDICTFDVTSNGGEGQIRLSDDEVITVNKVENNGGGDSSNTSGGAMNPFALLALAGLVFSRRRKKLIK